MCGSDGELAGRQHPLRLEEHLFSVSPSGLRSRWVHRWAGLPDHRPYRQWVEACLCFFRNLFIPFLSAVRKPVLCPFPSWLSEHLQGALCLRYRLLPRRSQMPGGVCVQHGFSWHQYGGHPPHTPLCKIRVTKATGGSNSFLSAGLSETSSSSSC